MILNIAKVTMANHHVVIFKLIQILGPFSNLTKKLWLIWLLLKLRDSRKSSQTMKM